MGGLFAAVLALAFQLPAWVGQMRSSIYGRIGPGFQLQQIWKMMKYDTNGLLRILGMVVLIGAILGTIFAVAISIFSVSAVMSFVAAGMNSSDASVMVSIPMFIFGSLLALVAFYALMFGGMWVQALECRALGYWTRQFNVPAWGGQDDPLPFETSVAARQAQQAQYAAQVQYTQAQAEAAQVQGQKIEYQNQQAQQQYAQAEAKAAQAAQQGAQAPVQPAVPAEPAPVQPTAPTNSPDWIAQANATAPAEQRSPYAAPASDVSAEPSQPQSPFEAPRTSAAQPDAPAAAFTSEVAQSADNLASKAYGVAAETEADTSATPAEPADAAEANKGAGLE